MEQTSANDPSPEASSIDPLLASVRSDFNYDPETGVLYWNIDTRATKKGRVAGTEHPETGYISVCYKYKRYQAHILIWFIMTGELLPRVDHRNGLGNDNRWKNLRKATHAQNSMNRGASITNVLGVKGVQRIGNRYRACITFDRKNYHLGMFDTIEEASAAHAKAARKFHGEFAFEARGDLGEEVPITD